MRYHISPKLGVKKCSVTVGTCHFPTSPHFTDVKKAHVQYEKMLTEELDPLKTLNKSSSDTDDKIIAKTLDELVVSSNENTPTSSVSWSANDGLKDASQYGKDVETAALDRIKKALISEKTITRDIISSVSTNVRMYELSERLKSPNSLSRKIKSKAVVLQGAGEKISPKELKHIANSLTDIVRYTFVSSSHNGMTGMISEQSKSLLDKGYTVKEAQNTYIEGNSYKGFSIIFESPDGEQFEVQYLSEDVVKIKKESHNHYEVMRDVTQPVMLRKAHEMMCVSLYDRVKEPEGLNDITEIDGVPVTRRSYKRL